MNDDHALHFDQLQLFCPYNKHFVIVTLALNAKLGSQLAND